MQSLLALAGAIDRVDDAVDDVSVLEGLGGWLPPGEGLDEVPELLREAIGADFLGHRVDPAHLGIRLLHEVVHRRDAAVRVARRPGESEQRTRQVAVDVEAGARDRARSERVAVRRVVGRTQTHDVALELLDGAEEIVGDGRRLRGLGVRVSREDRVDVAPRDVDERGPQVERRLHEVEHELALAHPVHRHVDVVAAAGHMEAAGRVLAGAGSDETLDVEEEVFAGAVEHLSADVVLADRVERRAQPPGVARREQAAVGEHHEMRVVDGEQRRQEQRLGVLEVLVEDERHVLRREAHAAECSRGGFGAPDDATGDRRARASRTRAARDARSAPGTATS